MQVDQRGVVSEVKDDDPTMLKHLEKIGLIPGVMVTVTDVLAVDGTRKLRSKKRILNVSSKVASAVWIKNENKGKE